MPAHRIELVPVGSTHALVRDVLDIKRGRAPKRDRTVVLEGLWALAHALRAGLRIRAVFVCEDLLPGEKLHDLVGGLVRSGTKACSVSERVLRRMVDRDGPDGIAALAEMRAWSIGDLEVDRSTRLVVADRFELAGNLGTTIRCADGAGARAVLVTEGAVRISHPLVLKASMATSLSMPLVEATRDTTLGWLRAEGVRVVAADPAATVDYRSADLRGPVAVVLGNERQGLASFWREHADELVAIPMLGVADSLNVGHAGALLLYEALHQNV